MIQIRGKILEADYLEAQRVHGRARRVIAVMGGVVIALGLVVTVFNIMSWWNGSRSATDAAMLPFLVALLSGYLFVFRPWIFRRTYRKYPALQEPVNLELGEGGMAHSSEHGNGEIPWRMFIKWREGKQLFLIYGAPNLFHIVPKRFLSTEGVDELRVLLSEKLGRAA